MSLNVTLATVNYVICVTDRRLTTLNGKIVTERSNKLTCFECKDAKGFITYNGIGQDQFGKSPSDWINEIEDIGSLDLDQFAERIRGVSESKNAALSSACVDRRHTFVIGAFLYPRAIPVVNLISNYEYLREDRVERSAAPHFWVEKGYARPFTRAKCILVTGAIDTLRRKQVKHLASLMDQGAALSRIRSTAAKVIRDSAYSKNRRGTVGTSVSSGILERNGRTTLDVNVVGGSHLVESPNVITRQFRIKDFYAYGGSLRSDFLPYDKQTRRASIPEPNCPQCGNPVPFGYKRCGICDSPLR